ncbi:MAG: hypothetical protein V7647_1391 [Acidobacteriota bacterium]
MTPLLRFELTAVLLGLVLLFTVVPHAITGDGLVRYDSLNKLLTTGTVPEQRYSYVGPLFAAPLWLAGTRTERLWLAERFNVMLLAAGALLQWQLLRKSLTLQVRSAFVLMLVAAGMMPNHVRDFYGEVFTAVAVASGLLIVLLEEHGAGWMLVVAGVVNTPASLGGLVLVGGWRWWRSRRYDAAAAVLVAAALVLLENLVVRGGVLATSYSGDRGLHTVLPFSGRSGFSYPLIAGLLSLLFSFGKGILFFSPGLLFVAPARRALDRRTAEVLDAWVLFLAGLLLVYARWWAWYGGWFWGPRFLLIAVFPSTLALAVMLSVPARPARRLAVGAVVLWTFWVGVSGAVFGNDGLGVCMENGYALEHLCWYVPEFSPLIRPLVIPPASLAGWQVTWMLFAAIAGAALATSSVAVVPRDAPGPDGPDAAPAGR